MLVFISPHFSFTRINKWDFRRSKVEGNTGFYFVRSTENTIKLWEEAYEASMRYSS